MTSQAKYLAYRYPTQDGEQAVLTVDDVDGSWTSEQNGLPLSLLNTSFKIYFDAYTAIAETLSNSPDNENTNYCNRMSKDLEAALKSKHVLWYRLGKVNCLDDAFHHLEDNGGRWTDDNLSGSYNGGVGCDRYVSPVPACAASFLKEVDERMEDLGTALEGSAKALREAKEGQDETNWEKAGRGLDAVAKYGKDIKPLLWLAPETLRENTDTVLEWNSKIKEMHEYAGQAMKIGASTRPGSEAFVMGMTKLLNYAPVLGGFYGRIVSEIPGMAQHWAESMSSYWGRRGSEPLDQGLNRTFRSWDFTINK